MPLFCRILSDNVCNIFSSLKHLKHKLLKHLTNYAIVLSHIVWHCLQCIFIFETFATLFSHPSAPLVFIWTGAQDHRTSFMAQNVSQKYDQILFSKIVDGKKRFLSSTILSVEFFFPSNWWKNLKIIVITNFFFS